MYLKTVLIECLRELQCADYTTDQAARSSDAATSCFLALVWEGALTHVEFSESELTSLVPLVDAAVLSLRCERLACIFRTRLEDSLLRERSSLQFLLDGFLGDETFSKPLRGGESVRVQHFLIRLSNVCVTTPVTLKTNYNLDNLTTVSPLPTLGGRINLINFLTINMGLGDILNGIPVIGHAKSGLHALSGNRYAADEAFKAANRTTVGMAADAAGGIVGGPAGMIGGAIAAGSAVDGVLSVANRRATRVLSSRVGMSVKTRLIECLRELQRADYTTDEGARRSDAATSRFLALVWEGALTHVEFSKPELTSLVPLLDAAALSVRARCERLACIFRTRLEDSLLRERSSLQFLLDDFLGAEASSKLRREGICDSAALLDTVIERWRDDTSDSEDEPQARQPHRGIPASHTWWTH
ncbi:unnamed protein product [Diatraea saccharalis]|uniref:Uncharacterized protein n=1 Tax=Diatraea saccharalis TaxID=40085 RepID=A0A9N9WKE5_9NEOP|nr:unnamed protein product [Diatraea saccharalis]